MQANLFLYTFREYHRSYYNLQNPICATEPCIESEYNLIKSVNLKRDMTPLISGY